MCPKLKAKQHANKTMRSTANAKQAAVYLKHGKMQLKHRLALKTKFTRSILKWRHRRSSSRVKDSEVVRGAIERSLA